ncbi:MAG: hypothetical protein WC160_03200 [Bacilli bacterium]
MFFGEDEYASIYAYVMRNSEREIIDKDEIIDYLVTQCYIIEQHNDLLMDIIEKIKSALGIMENDITITDDDLPF